MSLYKIQGKAEKRKGIYYEFDTDDEPLGVGGMGKVYKGRLVDEATGRAKDVAVKFMYSDLPPYAIEKARREAAIQFRHDNLIEMLGFIETESKTVLGEVQHHYHVVSELLTGVSLDHLFEGKLTDQHGHRVPFAEKLYRDYRQDANHFAVEVIKNILSGLMRMHDAGYIHRDIDPTNIMITTDGHIKLIDFGIAKKVNTLTTNDKHLTQAGQFIGKPEYAAPELVLGAIDEQNQTTDIYAVGILLFQCIVGHTPFEGDRSDILQKQLHSPLPLKLIKHKGIRKIIARATEKSRAKRFQSAAEFRVALEQLTFDRHAPFWRPAYTYAATGAAAAVIAGAGLMFFLGGDKPTGTPQPVASAPAPPATYPAALADLHSKATAGRGIDALRHLSDQGDARATYLLSRLYFESKLPDDYCPDSIKALRASLGLKSDDQTAHSLLQKAVSQDPANYAALFDLACDFWKADQRTDAVPRRDGQRAETLFRQARAHAEQAGDVLYVELIDGYLGRIAQWKENLHHINAQ